MKKQQTRVESTAKFTPSDPDAPYLADKQQPAGSLQPIDQSRYHLDAAGITVLTALAKDINKTYDAAVKSSCKFQIKIGKLLLEARALFPGDKEFGNWRSDNTEIKSKSVAHRLMQIADRFGNAPKMVEFCSPTVLSELVSAPDQLVKEIERDMEEGKPAPTVKVVQAAKKSSVPSLGPQGTSKKPKTIYDKPERNIEAEAVEMVQKDLLARLNHKNPYVKLGLYPFGGPPHPYVLDALEHWWEQEHDKSDTTDEQLDKIYQAIAAIHKENRK